MRKCLIGLLFLLVLAACGGSASEKGETAVSAPIPDIISSRLPAGFDVQGHRGARGLKPENTLPAFETALDLGVTTLELDLHYAADSVVVILEELFQFVESYSQSELKSAAQRANAQLVMFNIETKRKPDLDKAIGDNFDGENPGPFELEILRIIAEYGIEDRTIIQSFDHRSLWAIRSVNETIRLAALTSRESADITGFAEQGANIWSMNYSALTPQLVSKAHKVGLLVIPWTVNEAEDMQELIEMGVDGIISDRPDILLNLEP